MLSVLSFKFLKYNSEAQPVGAKIREIVGRVDYSDLVTKNFPRTKLPTKKTAWFQPRIFYIHVS